MSKITNLEVGEVGLLVELRRLKTEGVDDVVDRLRTLLEGILLLLSGGVGAWISEVSIDRPRVDYLQATCRYRRPRQA